MPEIERPKPHRVWLRHPSHQCTYCKSAATEDELSWSAQVQELSCRGLNLICHRLFEPETLVMIGMFDASDQTAPLLARVVEATSQSGGSWLMTCTFPKEPGEADIRAWLKSQA